jgi:agmatinase
MASFSETFGLPEPDSSTFMGLPACDDLSQLEATVAIVGAPIATPYPGFGLYAATSPVAIREAIADQAALIGHHDFELDGSLLDEKYGPVIDAGNLATSEADYANNRNIIREAVAGILDANARPLVVGGDDSVPIPVFQAYEGRGPYTILQIDAHMDWRDEVNGERLGLSSTMRRASEMNHIERIIQVGMRSVGSARTVEVRDALNWGATIVTAQEVYRSGVGPVLDLISPGSRVLATFDCDALDSGIMPAVLAPNPGGLTYWHVVELLQGVARKAELCGFNLVEFMPARDHNGTAGLLAARLALIAAASMARVEVGEHDDGISI